MLRTICLLLSLALALPTFAVESPSPDMQPQSTKESHQSSGLAQASSLLSRLAAMTAVGSFFLGTIADQVQGPVKNIKHFAECTGEVRKAIVDTVATFFGFKTFTGVQRGDFSKAALHVSRVAIVVSVVSYLVTNAF